MIDEMQETLQQETQVEQPEQVQDEMPAQSEVAAPYGSQPEPQQKTETEGQRHFKNLRDKVDRIERERDELYRMLQEERSRKSATPDEDLSFNIGEDEIAEGKHLSKVQKKINRLEQQIQSYQQQTSQIAIEAKLRAEYPDIESVISGNNLRELADKYPALAKTLDANTDLYNKAVAAYTMIKNFGIGQPDPYAEDKARAQRNAAKPRTAAYVAPQQGDTPLSRANAFAAGLTPDLQKQLWHEMQEAIKKS